MAFSYRSAYLVTEWDPSSRRRLLVEACHPFACALAFFQLLQSLWQCREGELSALWRDQAAIGDGLQQSFTGHAQGLAIRQPAVGMNAVERHFMQRDRRAEGGRWCGFLAVLDAHEVAVVAEQVGKAAGMGAADGVEQGMQRALAQGGLQLVLPVGSW